MSGGAPVTVPATAVPAVVVRNLTVSYPGRPGPVTAVQGLDFTIAAGESYGLVGESGSGKSTAAMTLTRYLPPGTGISATELSVAGVPVLGLDAPALRRFRVDDRDRVRHGGFLLTTTW